MKYVTHLLLLSLLSFIFSCSFFKGDGTKDLRKIPNWVSHVMILKLNSLETSQKKIYFNEVTKYLLGYNLSFIENTSKIVGGFSNLRQLTEDKYSSGIQREIFFLLEGNYQIESISKYMSENETYNFDKKTVNGKVAYYQNSGDLSIILVDDNNIIVTTKVRTKDILKWYPNDKTETSILSKEYINSFDLTDIVNQDSIFFFQNDNDIKSLLREAKELIGKGIGDLVLSYLNNIKGFEILAKDESKELSVVQVNVLASSEEYSKKIKTLFDTLIMIVDTEISNYKEKIKELSLLTYKLDSSIENNISNLTLKINPDTIKLVQKFFEQQAKLVQEQQKKLQEQKQQQNQTTQSTNSTTIPPQGKTK